MTPAIIAVLLIIIGITLGWVFARWRQNRGLAEHATFQARAIEAESTIKVLREQNKEVSSKLDQAYNVLTEEQEKRVAAEVRLSEERKNIEEQRKLLADAEVKLRDTFKALSDEALKSNNTAFLTLARSSLEKALTEAKGDLGQRQEAIKGLVKPLEDALKRYEEHVSTLELSREEAYGKLTQQITTLAQTEERLQREAESLVSALRLPQVRGRWGEMTLRRVIELSGMSEHCDFMEQPSVTSDERRLKPDLVVALPASRQVVVDAKTPLNAYLNAIEALNDEQRNLALQEHAGHLRSHMRQLSAKEYWQQFPTAPEFVIMFIPGESFFSAALRFDKTLIEDGIANRVVIATPTTLIALLRSIAYGWRQEQLTQNAQEIAEIGKQVYSRFRTFVQHVQGLRKDLEQSVYSFNRMLGSLEGRVLPGVRKFKELGATGEESLEIIAPIDQTPRQFLPQEETQESSEAKATND